MRSIHKEQMPVLAREVGEMVVVARTGSGGDEPHSVSAAFLIYLRGDLGAGKTTFTQALARELGIDASVRSPTFSLMKIYPIHFHGFTRFVHIDAYRLHGAEEFATLAPETFLNDPQVIVCIEWPEQAGNALPEPDLGIAFSHPADGNENVREVTVNSKPTQA